MIANFSDVSLFIISASLGREFVFGLIQGYSTYISKVTLNIASQYPGMVWVRAPSVGINHQYLIHAGTREIVIPYGIIQTTNHTIENKTIHLVSDTDISVHVLYHGSYYYCQEGFLVLPIRESSKRFVIATARPYRTSNPAEVSIAAHKNSTTVVITFPQDLTGMFVADTKLTLTLNEYQTYQFKSKYDLSGALIQSSHPISVTAGNSYTTIQSTDGYPSVLIEQMPSIDFLDKYFLIPPLHGRSKYMFKLTAPENHISLTVLNSTGSYNFMIYRDLPLNLFNDNEPVFISSDRPILITQYSLDYKVDSFGGAFVWIVPSIFNYLDRYDFFIPSDQSSFTNYLCVIATTENIVLDSAKIPSTNTSFINTPKGNFTIFTTTVSVGRHSITSTNRSQSYGAFLYGYKTYAGYGFPLGMKTTAKGKIDFNIMLLLKIKLFLYFKPSNFM